MARKDSFDIGRFGRFLSFELKETVRENGLFILLAGLVPLMLLIVTFLFSLTYNPEKIGEVWSGYAGLKAFVATVAIVLFLLIFPILKYGDITDRRKGQMPLMLPSSHAEKACSAFLVSVIIVPAVFMLLYFGTDALLCAVFPECGKSLAGYYARTGLIDFFQYQQLFRLLPSADGFPCRACRRGAVQKAQDHQDLLQLFRSLHTVHDDNGQHNRFF